MLSPIRIMRGTVSLSVCEVVNDNMHYVCLIVEDDGKERVRTVEQLMSENEGSERDMSAAQMGFTIMQQMIEAHYGTITLESTEGRGRRSRSIFPPTEMSLKTIRIFSLLIRKN